MTPEPFPLRPVWGPFVMLAACVLAFACFLVTGCTIVPKPVPVAKVPALHGNTANAGVLDLTADGAHIDGANHALYNSLITLPDGRGKTLGAHFLPPLVPNAGVSRINPADGSCWLDKENAKDFGMMLWWHDNPAQLPP